MKKTILMFVFAVAALSVTSCKKESQVQPANDLPTETVIDNTAAALTYSCPMDCENGKIYLEKGKCPVCEMELVASTEAAAESDEGHEGHDHDSHEGHNH
jgi:hypothetical protein